MTLRTRLLAGYLVFVVALALLGGWSAYHLRRASDLSRRIVSENYDSIVAAQDMKESLERQDSAALFALLGLHERAFPQVQTHRKRFDTAFAKAANNITEPGEREIIEVIRRGRDEYYQQFDRFLATVRQGTAPGTPSSHAKAGPSAYFNELEPLFNRVRAACDRLLQLNENAVLRKSVEAARLARRWFLTTLMLAFGLVGAGVGLAFVFSDRIVRPLRQLTDATARLAAGDLDASVAVKTGDEIGVLAAGFNQMAERIRQLRRSDLGKVLLAQQTTEAAIDSLYDPVLVTDDQARVTKLNPAAEHIFGPERENIDQPIAKVARDGRIALAVTEALRSQRAVAGEGAAAVLSLAVNGAEHAFRLRTTPMRDSDQRLLGAVTLLQDITHLREIDRLKSEFIASASHELRTPLTSLKMGIHLLLEKAQGELAPRQQEILQMCRDDAARLDRLMRELLDLSKAESGEASPRLAAVPAAALLNHAAEPLRQAANAKGLSFEVDVAPDLPVVLADEGQVARVVSNLVTNAIRATDRAGRITLTAVKRDGYVAVSVTDNGRGIPADYLGRIFDPFVQVPDAPSGGAGLGLAISRRIIEAHGGQLTVQSEPGRGTTFTFSLPIKEGGALQGIAS